MFARPDTPTIPLGTIDDLRGIETDTVGCLVRLQRRHGSLVSFAKGSDLAVFAFSPEANYDIFTNTDTYHAIAPPGPRGSSQRRFQKGIFGLSGATHVQHRRLLMPPLRKEVVVGHAEAMSRHVDAFLDRVGDGEEFDLYAEMKALSLALAADLLFGFDEIPRAREFAATFQRWLDRHIASLFEMSLPVAFGDDNYGELLATASVLEGHYRELIERWRARPGRPSASLFAALMAARDAGQIGEDEVIGEMQSLLNASYQTLGSALTWTMFLIAQHPSTNRRLRALVESSPLDQARNSPLVDGVVKESLRILPPVVFVVRYSNRAGSLAGRPLPERAIVFSGIYATHHAPELFSEPERFLPERWLNASVSPYAYLPFGAGSRMCMGTAFSLQFLKIVVPAFVQRFRLEIPSGTRVDRRSNLTLGVQGSLPARCVPQDGRFEAASLTGNIHEMVDLPTSAPARRAA